MFPFLMGAMGFAAVAAWLDFRTGRISNRLTILGAVLAVGGHFVRGAELGGLHEGAVQAGLAIAGGVLSGIVPLFMCLRGAMGAGDVKMFAAIGAALHPLVGLEAETYAFVAAAVIAPAKLAWEGTLLRTLWNTAAVLTNPFRRAGQKREVPEAMRAWFRLGPAMLVGTIATAIVHSYSLEVAP